MNILFVNYGDFTTNSLNHIGGFANALCAAGHACVVAVPHGKETAAHVRQAMFIPATYADVLTRPDLFPNGKPADVIHAWTPREGVRKFVLAYQRTLPAAAPARLIIHLEDNERFLLEAFTGKTFAALREAPAAEIDAWLVDGLPHPLRHESFLRVADGVTHIIDRLKEFAPPGVPTQLLPPGVDFDLYRPQLADAALRAELGLRPEEKVVVFTGSNTFANEPEMRELYVAIALLNAGGTPTRLVRTGINSPKFLDGLTPELRAHVLDLGFVEKGKLPRLLALAEALVQPGRSGAFNDYRLPSKLPEFLAMGQAVALPPTNLATLMQDGREAVFLPTGAPEEIAHTLRALFADPARRAALGKNAAAFARQHFDLAAHTRSLAAFYTAVTQRPSTADWSLARDPFATETAMVMALARAHAASPELELVGLVARQLDAALERIRTQPDLAVNQLSARMRELAEHCARLQTALDETRHTSDRHIANLKEGLRLTQNHAENLERTLRETTSHAGNLERELGDMRPRHARGEVLRVQAETLLRSALHQCHAYEREIERLETEWQARLNLSETNFRASDREARYYRQLLQQHYEESRALAARAHDAARVHRDALHAKAERIAQLEHKVRRMTDTFSWKSTAWLRALRRALFDSKKSAADLPPTVPQPALEALATVSAPPTLTFRFSVDYPQAWSFPAKKLLVRGWCLAVEPDAEVKHLRATVNGRRRFPGVYGLKRLDVFATMRDLPQAEYCGWKVEIPLELGDTELVLEVGDEAGAWHVFFATPLRVGDDAGPPELTSYERWAATFDTHSPEALLKLAEESRAFAHRPLISIIVPIYNTPERWLLKVVDSVRAQTYDRWELCLADDASPHAHVRPLLEKLAASDPRIKVTFREKNGHISAASNSALELATGEFVALLDHDDELAPHALHEIVALLNAQPATDLIYSDEDKIDEEGRRHEPYFKPDWLPDLFTAQNFISHLTTYRMALVREVGGFRVGFEGSQDWDLALRVIERIADPARIRHIPKILYHWRAIPGSTALMLSEKNYPLEAARRALTDHFARRGEKVTLHHVPGDHWRVQYPLPATPPPVSLVIPTRNGLKFLQRCVDSILEKTTYPHYEILIVDNGSDDPATLAYLESFTKGTNALLVSINAQASSAPGATQPRVVRVLRYDAPFNFSAINNFAVAQAQGELVGLLNNDLEVITPAWLEEMAAQALRPGVGCVGAMLYYPNDTIQHAGVIVGLGGVAGHAFRDYPRGTDGKFNRARLVQNYSAVTAACLVVRKATYTQVGGLDERQLTVAFNDIDFCLKVRAAGHRNLWTPFAELYHHESVSRGAEDTPAKHERFRGEVETMMQRWAAPIRHDPAYNPNLSLEHTDFSLAAPPRPWSATA